MNTFTQVRFRAATFKDTCLKKISFIEQLLINAFFFIIKKLSGQGIFFIINFFSNDNFNRKQNIETCQKNPKIRLSGKCFLVKQETGMHFSSNNFPGHCPNLVVISSIFSQRPCLQNCAIIFFHFS